MLLGYNCKTLNKKKTLKLKSRFLLCFYSILFLAATSSPSISSIKSGDLIVINSNFLAQGAEVLNEFTFPSLVIYLTYGFLK